MSKTCFFDTCYSLYIDAIFCVVSWFKTQILLIKITFESFFFHFCQLSPLHFQRYFFFNGFKSLFVSVVSIPGPLIKVSEVLTSKILPLKRYGRWDNFIITKYRDKSFYEKFSTELNFLICYFVCIDVIFGRVSRFKT